jgi:hypothetical protein
VHAGSVVIAPAYNWNSGCVQKIATHLPCVGKTLFWFDHVNTTGCVCKLLDILQFFEEARNHAVLYTCKRKVRSKQNSSDVIHTHGCATGIKEADTMCLRRHAPFSDHIVQTKESVNTISVLAKPPMREK